MKILRKSQKGLLIKAIDELALINIAKQVGYDVLLFDCEHGVLSYERLHDIILYGNALEIPSFVRVPQLDKHSISCILDYGASGVMVPMIETKEQAEQLVAYSKYPPLGKRSYAGGAHTGYAAGGNHQYHMEQANAKLTSIVQIESLLGVQNIEEILSVEGIDAVIIGPCDLGISIQNPDNVMDPRELALIDTVVLACCNYQKQLGIIGDLTLLRQYHNHLEYVFAAVDLNLLRDGLKMGIERYKQLYTEEIHEDSTRTSE